MIVDTHAHFGNAVGMFCFKETIAEGIEYMQQIGCDYAVQAFAGGTIDPHTDMEGYRTYIPRALDVYEMSKGRIVNYFVFNPNIVDISLDMIDNYHEHPAVVGVKIHPSDHRVSADDEIYRVLWERCAKYGLPIMSHTWALTSNPKQILSIPQRFEKYLKDYPEVNFTFGHSGGRYEGIKDAAALGKKYRNAYFDIGGDIYNRHLIEYLAGEVGADRVLAASDINWFDFNVQIGMILGCNLTSEEKALILGKNAARLYGLPELKEENV
ncbi:MAG: amidohydrolase [Clostridia bacterium]|nr:amidohydrolase [Clostridia bacterium]